MRSASFFEGRLWEHLHGESAAEASMKTRVRYLSWTQLSHGIVVSFATRQLGFTSRKKIYSRGITPVEAEVRRQMNSTAETSRSKKRVIFQDEFDTIHGRETLI
ncbi:MAG: hypothetical protein ACLPX5_11630 [Dissulfurispiraceae bacterium]